MKESKMGEGRPFGARTGARAFTREPDEEGQ